VLDAQRQAPCGAVWACMSAAIRMAVHPHVQCTLRTGGPGRGRRARRQADYAIASLDALPAVVAAVAGRVPVLMDGGVRRGTDIIKVRRGGADPVSPWTRPARACAWSQRLWWAGMCERARLCSACYVRRRASHLSAACRAA